MTTSHRPTLYIAGPMTGIEDFNYPAFREAGRKLRVARYGVLNPVDTENENSDGTTREWAWYMRHALRMVLNADAIAVLPDWIPSQGAWLEVTVARALTLPVRTVDEWLAMRGGTA